MADHTAIDIIQMLVQAGSAAGTSWAVWRASKRIHINHEERLQALEEKAGLRSRPEPIGVTLEDLSGQL
jgi:hypothetical protein